MKSNMLNILLIASAAAIVNTISGVNGTDITNLRQMGDLDFLHNKSILDTKSIYDTNNAMDGKGVSISATSPPAVTVTPTTTLNVTPAQNQTGQDVHFETFQHNPLDVAEKKFENMVADDTNGNLRKGTNVHCGTTHIAVTCASRKDKKRKGLDDIKDADEMVDESQQLDEAPGEDQQEDDQGY